MQKHVHKIYSFPLIIIYLLKTEEEVNLCYLFSGIIILTLDSTDSDSESMSSFWSGAKVTLFGLGASWLSSSLKAVPVSSALDSSSLSPDAKSDSSEPLSDSELASSAELDSSSETFCREINYFVILEKFRIFPAFQN